VWTDQQAASELERALNYHQEGDLRAAAAIYRQLLQQRPDQVNALHSLGVLSAQTGDYAAAVDLIKQAIAVRPMNPDYHNDLGLALHALGQRGAAITAYQRAVQLSPSFEALSNLGAALLEEQRSAEATSAFEQALVFKPDAANVQIKLGDALKAQGQQCAAINAYRRALAIQPGFEACHQLATALHERGESDEAVTMFRQALTVKPDSGAAYYNLGNALRAGDKLTEALDAYQRATQLTPENINAYNNLGMLLQARGDLDAAVTAYRQALALDPHFHDAHSNLLLCLHYRPHIDTAELFAEHRRWGERHAASLAAMIPAHGNERSAARRLRIGYVSPDFRAHSVSHFIAPVLAAHDHAHYEVFCYSNLTRADATTERLRGLTDHWRDIAHLNDAEVTTLIGKDGIDILVDLAGHTANNRLLVFARKPAPVQVTYLGYPDTTGLAVIDYRLTDALADPPGTSERFHTEALIRLPRGFLTYQPPLEGPEINTLPALASGHITFGSFNNAAKLNETVIALWAQILSVLPRARLILKAAQLGDATTAERFRARFAEHGITPARVQTLGAYAAEHDHLKAYHGIDIALDPFPYNGTTTTCEALWMGVPVITLAGQTHAGRVGVSLLTQAGLHDLITESPEHYLALAVDLAHDLQRLQGLRGKLRERLAASALCDAKGFTRALEEAYRGMWVKYCENPDTPSKTHDPD
jgi:predicted O-linked N-acetylglucosamine transferase (SPINDLY family)